MAYPNLTQELLRSIQYPEPIHQPVADERFRLAIRSVLALYDRGVIDSERRDRLIRGFITAIVSRKVERMLDEMTDAVLSVSNEPGLTQTSGGYLRGMLGSAPPPSPGPLYPRAHHGDRRD